MTIPWLLAAASASPPPQQATLAVSVTQSSATIPPHDVLEITFHHEGSYENPIRDVRVAVAFESPSGKKVQVGGFHASPGQWKARFAPRETGPWTYTYTLSSARRSVGGSGSFRCVESRAHNRGFVRPAPGNRFRWVYDDGTPYFPIGLQECLFDDAGIGAPLAAVSMEGPFRLDREGLPKPPKGAIYRPGPANNPVNGDVYFRNYGRAGFNLFRFSQQNCSFPLTRDLDGYLAKESGEVDDILRCARKYGMSVMYGVFGSVPVRDHHPGDPDLLAKEKRFVAYSVDRWGAYVDIWELCNEQTVDAKWNHDIATHLRSIDPYRHPITTSWERPDLAEIEVSAPHWYAERDEASCEQETAAHAAEWKKAGKPVIVGEHGNKRLKRPLPGIGGPWDIGSSLRMRIRDWTALFYEIALVMWNSSYAKDGAVTNIWLGPKERQYVKAMQDFASRLDADVRMVPVALSDARAVHAFGLASGRQAAVYLHHASDRATVVKGLRVTLDVPLPATAYWYAPVDAAILGRADAPRGRRTFSAPPFSVDLALLVTPDGAPDVDHDGIANDLDDDDDGDGVPDKDDAFPLDPEEWADKDGDLIGDNMDADVASNGIGDDKNGNGIPDWKEMDYDGDGVPRAGAVPWDAFPWDKTEWRDTDGDGIGDNADTDKDGDGFTDAEERKAGTDPLDGTSFPAR